MINFEGPTHPTNRGDRHDDREEKVPLEHRNAHKDGNRGAQPDGMHGGLEPFMDLAPVSGPGEATVSRESIYLQ